MEQFLEVGLPELRGAEYPRVTLVVHQRWKDSLIPRFLELLSLLSFVNDHTRILATSTAVRLFHTPEVNHTSGLEAHLLSLLVLGFDYRLQDEPQVEPYIVEVLVGRCKVSYRISVKC